MSKDLNCKKHKYIGRKIESSAKKQETIIECKICGGMYFSQNHLKLESFSKNRITICSGCREKIKCSGCKCDFKVNNFFIAECIKCGKVDFFCAKCSKKIFTLPAKSKNSGKILSKLQEIFKEVIPQIGDNLPKNLSDFTQYKSLDDAPALLFFIFNINMPDTSDSGEHEADEDDWWKKTN